MGSEKWDFDKRAASWDEDPGRVRLATDIASAISDEKILTADMDVLEFGCGTGLLTLRLQPLVRSIVGVDSSQGMLDICRAKIESLRITNVKTHHLDSETAPLPAGSYNLVVCGMTLHHVRETTSLIGQFARAIMPGGYLCIADLDTEDGGFHGDNDTVFHHGFDRAALSRLLRDAGFDDLRERTAANVVKRVPDGSKRSFPVFLITAWKKA